MECCTARVEMGSARASRAAVDALVHRNVARHRAMFQPGRTDNARWRASIPTAMARLGTREARVLPVQKEWVVTTSGSSLASASLVRFDAFALLPGQEGVDRF